MEMKIMGESQYGKLEELRREESEEEDTETEDDVAPLQANKTIQEEEGGGDYEKKYPFTYDRFVWVFPNKLERWLSGFDDPIIKLFQIPSGPVFFAFSMALTGVTTIEVCIVLPFVFFAVGYDSLGILWLYLSLSTAFVSQIPKRFFWRFRPYMVDRAVKCRSDKTSSFPSRAVTCAVVYSFGISWSYYVHYEKEKTLELEWWMPLLGLVLVFATSFARVNLGAHYPSDCLAGALQGMLVSGVGFALHEGEVFTCGDCEKDKCYSDDKSLQLNSSLVHVCWWSFVVGLFVLLGFVAIAMVRPIQFWVKSDRVCGLLFPCILFSILFLCPTSCNSHYALPPPEIHWFSFVYAVSVAFCVSVVAVGAKIVTPKKYYFSYVSFLVVFFVVFVALSFWRLFVTQHLS